MSDRKLPERAADEFDKARQWICGEELFKNALKIWKILVALPILPKAQRKTGDYENQCLRGDIPVLFKNASE